MSISFHFTLSFHAAAFLVEFGEHVRKFGKFSVCRRKATNSAEAESSWHAIPKGPNFTTAVRQLKRQGFLSIPHDSEGRAISWDVTAKGFAMIDVLEFEIRDIRKTLNLSHHLRDNLTQAKQS